MPKTYLVTGAGGMLGRRFVQMICKRNVDFVTHLRLLDIQFSEDTKNEQKQSCKGAGIQVEWIIADITDYVKVSHHVSGVDVVIHMASLIDYLDLVPFTDIWKINVGGTQNIIKACLRFSVKGLVYTSSVQAKCYNVHMDSFDGDEDTPYLVKPLGNYGKTKFAAEKSVLEANWPGSFHTCALRPSSLYGYIDNVMKIEIENLPKNKKLFLFAEKSYLQSRIDFDNAAWCHILAAKCVQAKCDLVGGYAYFIGDDTPDMSVSEFHATLHKPRGYKLSDWCTPFYVLYFISCICLFLNKLFRVVGIDKKIYLSPSVVKLVWTRTTTSDKKFRKHFGYTPIYSWAESLRKMRNNVDKYLDRNK